MKILSFNVRSWYRDTKKSSPYYWVKRAKAMRKMLEVEDPDIICFQEMLFPMTIFIPKGYRRVGFSISHHIYVRTGVKATNGRWHVHYVSCVCNGFKLASVHGRWESDRTDKLCNDLYEWADGKAIAMGDFNVGVNALASRYMPKTAREHLGMPYAPTFKNFKTGNEGEIDHCVLLGIIPKDYRIITDNYGVERVSDHYPIVLEF